MYKIGIITFHSAENYGAFLQTFASQNLLKQLSEKYTVEVVDYRPWYINNTYKLFFPRYEKNLGSIRFIRYFIINVIFTPKRIWKKIKFKMSLKKLNLSVRYPSSKSNVFHYDILFCGSDQIWNADITKGVDPVYYGQLINNYPCRKIAYAASFGANNFKEDILNEMIKYINMMDAISIREKSSIPLFEKMSPKACKVVLDPTLMLNQSFWRANAKNVLCKNKYLLIYQLGNNIEILEDACVLADKMGLEIVCLNELGRKKSRFRGHKLLSKSTFDPFEFLGAILNATVILTDSFHGTCFSIIFEKEFITYLGEKRNERITDLLDKLGLQNRIKSTKKNSVLKIVEELINYESVRSELECMREESLNFIRDNIK